MRTEENTTVTQRLIAERVGVSQRLVAYALNGNGRMGAETRRKVLDEANRLGYRPNRAARALVTGRSNLIALCLPHLASTLSNEIIYAVESMIRPLPYDLIVTGIDGINPDGSNIAHFLSQWSVDGALFVDPTWLPILPALRDHLRITVMGRQSHPNAAAFDYVCVDVKAAAHEAMQHLHEIGCRKIAYLAYQSAIDAGEGRYHAYLEKTKAYGQEPLLITFENNGRMRPQAAATLQEYLSHNPAFDGLLCINDEVALGAYRAIKTAGLKIPRDVAVMGFDGVIDTTEVTPTLTTVELPVSEMISQAWQLLLQRMEYPELPTRSITLQAHPIHRESTHRPN